MNFLEAFIGSTPAQIAPLGSGALSSPVRHGLEQQRLPWLSMMF
ncbi:MAG: hypothetical protein ACFB8W_01085 [Elainellaceae cyanobacterium]